MTINRELLWLGTIESLLCSHSSGGADFYYLVATMVKEGRFSFPQLLSLATQGHGLTIHEGLSYALDQDWDNPASFDHIAIFVGDIESSALSIKDYLHLLHWAATTYAEIFPEHQSGVLEKLSAVLDRYTATR